jgi:hypothetical protein
VFNATFNNISAILWRSVLLVEETTDLSQVTVKLYHIMLHTSPWSRFKLTTSVVIDRAFIWSCRNSTSTLYSTAGYFLCIKDKKCIIYSQSRYHDNDHVFFPPLPIAYYRHDYWPLNCKQYKPNRQKSRCFSLASESLVPVYGMNKFYTPTKNQSTLTLFNQAPPVGKSCINSVPLTMQSEVSKSRDVTLFF